jgi:hypothetical protein
MSYIRQNTSPQEYEVIRFYLTGAQIKKKAIRRLTNGHFIFLKLH